ncbi:MAG: hypothetical protein NTZ74_15560 [Chloroflexi bacterium]|nr:hypothetical protein [Chloroflexota bacterium]
MPGKTTTLSLKNYSYSGSLSNQTTENNASKVSATLLRLSPLQADGALRLRKNIGCLKGL